VTEWHKEQSGSGRCLSRFGFEEVGRNKAEWGGS
jgi:hypothetical protein